MDEKWERVEEALVLALAALAADGWPHPIERAPVRGYRRERGVRDMYSQPLRSHVECGHW